jgi:hypothetical protein
MTRRSPTRTSPVSFETAAAIALAMPEVEAATRYDGSPVLKARGRFMAGLASHPSAEPETLVVRIPFEDREGLLEDAAETYYVTDDYRPHPVVLVRLARIDRDALRDLLAIAYHATLARTGALVRARRVRPRSG